MTAQIQSYIKYKTAYVAYKIEFTSKSNVRNKKLCTKVDYFLFGHKLSWATAHYIRCNGRIHCTFSSSIHYFSSIYYGKIHCTLSSSIR